MKQKKSFKVQVILLLDMDGDTPEESRKMAESWVDHAMIPHLLDTQVGVLNDDEDGYALDLAPPKVPEGKWRPLKGDEVAYLHNDGHNYPTVHIFRDAAHVVQYIDDSDCTIEAVLEGDEFRDANGDLWQPYGNEGPYVVDHTEDKHG